MAERGIYRSIPCALLAGKDFRALSERARWVFVVLKMNIGAVGIDTWYPDELISRLSSESGCTGDQARLALEVLEREGWVAREDNIVWVRGHITHDPHLAAANPKHRKSVLRHLAGLPRLPIVRRFLEAHPEWSTPDELKAVGMEWVANGYRVGSGTVSSVQNKPRIQEKEEDKEKDTEKEKATASANAEPRKPVGLDILSRADCDALFERWSRLIGAIPYARFRKALLVVLASEAGRAFTISELLASIGAFAEWYAEQDDREQRFISVEKGFADQVPKWVRFGKMPHVSGGEMTERGSWAGSKALRQEAAAKRSA